MSTANIQQFFSGIPGRAVILDTETTGLSPDQGHRLVEIAGIEMIDGHLTGKSFHSYINPCRSVPRVASDVHGLTTEFLRDKPKFRMVFAEMMEFLGTPDTTELWAHNAAFDMRFVRAEAARLGEEIPHVFRCSLKLARRVIAKPEVANHKLETLAARAGHEWTGDAHSAFADIEALASVLQRLVWPRAVQATSPAPEIPKPRSKTAAPKKSATREPNKPANVPLPASPISREDDARIRRYDNINPDLLTKRGQKWTPKDENSLLVSFLQKRMPVEDIVSALGRSPAALFLKLEALRVIAPDHPYRRRVR